MLASSINVDPESALREAVAECARDPLKFCLLAWPWGEPGTPLEAFKQPEPWQIESLRDLRDHLQKTPFETFRESIAAAHGTGKSARLSMLIMWALSTMPDARVLATASTEQQLLTKLSPELSRWFHACLTRHWFKLNTMSLHSVAKGHEKTWRADLVTWDEKNPEAFAGLHNIGRRTAIFFDEAAGIPQGVWDTASGALSDCGTEKMFFVSSNATRNSGPFFETHHSQRHLWRTRKIDGRDVGFTDKQWIAEAIEEFGLGSDYVKVRILGEWPNVGEREFIGRDVVDQAMRRVAACYPNEPLLAGVDVARFGSDRSVIAFRRGRDCATWPWVTLRNTDLMTLAGEVARLCDEYGVDYTFVDGCGLGGGVVDALRSMGRPVYDVQFGARPNGGFKLPYKVKNHRSECWANMKEFLPTAMLPDDKELESDLCSGSYFFDAAGALMLESKDDMRKRGLSSPDKADALALTFSVPVVKATEHTAFMRAEAERERREYNPYVET